MIKENDIQLIIENIRQKVNLSINLPDEYYYAHLPCCIIDAVFSIGVRYSSTRNVVIRYCEYLEIDRIRNNRNSEYPLREYQNSVDDLLNLYHTKGVDYITQKVFQNKQRTSSNNGILKTEAVKHFASVLKTYNINHFQDLDIIENNLRFSEDIKKIKGQSSGISLKYFLMLSGNENLVKPDRMLKRFIAMSIKKNEIEISDDDVQFAVQQIIEREVFSGVRSIRHLDYLIWNFQSMV